MAWRGDRWSDVVERAAQSGPRKHKPLPQRESRASLAARAQEWRFEDPTVRVTEEGVRLGHLMESVEVPFAGLYHVEPVDPWPSLAVGWVDLGESYRTILKPRPHLDVPEKFAEHVEEVVEACTERVSSAVQRGWMEASVEAWQPTDAMPDERSEGPVTRGYRMAPARPDEILARRSTSTGAPSLWTWLWARFWPSPTRRLEPKDVVVTQRFVYARTRTDQRYRLPAKSLRTQWRTPHGDRLFVFGRYAELLLVEQGECEVAALLSSRL